MSDITLEPITKPFTATITPPGSKSLSNRALVLAALADGASELTNVLVADDTAAMLNGLKALGFAIDLPRVSGKRGAIPNASAELFCDNSGTTIRFLTAMC